MSGFLNEFIAFCESKKHLRQEDLEDSGFCDSLIDALSNLRLEPDRDREQAVKMMSEDYEIFAILGEWIVHDEADNEFAVNLISATDLSEYEVEIMVRVTDL